MSQSLDFAGRQDHARAKLEVWLTDEGEKPKQMRCRTFEGIRKKLEERDLRSTAALLTFMARHGLTEDRIKSV